MIFKLIHILSTNKDAPKSEVKEVCITNHIAKTTHTTNTTVLTNYIRVSDIQALVDVTTKAILKQANLVHNAKVDTIAMFIKWYRIDAISISITLIIIGILILLFTNRLINYYKKKNINSEFPNHHGSWGSTDARIGVEVAIVILHIVAFTFLLLSAIQLPSIIATEYQITNNIINKIEVKRDK